MQRTVLIISVLILTIGLAGCGIQKAINAAPDPTGTTQDLYALSVARDNRRLDDVHRIQSALQSYLGDRGEYPDTLGQLTPDYLVSALNDPKTTIPYPYAASADHKAYALTYTLETSVQNLEAGEHHATQLGIATP